MTGVHPDHSPRRSLTFAHEGLTFEVLTGGPPTGAGDPVVLLHGFPQDATSFDQVAAGLHRQGLRTLAPHQRGYRSGARPRRVTAYRIDRLVGDVLALLDSQGIGRVHLVGHDWGGAVAWFVAARHPERVASLVVLSTPHPAALAWAMRHSDQWRRSWYMLAFQLPWLPEWLLTRDDAGTLVRMLKASSVDRSHFSPEELRPFRDAIQRPGAATAMVNWYRTAVRQGFRSFRTPVPYPPITCETMLVWGMQDPALGFDELVPGTEKWAPKLAIEEIPGCGHFVQSERPAEVNRALVRFLSASAPATA